MLAPFYFILKECQYVLLRDLKLGNLHLHLFPITLSRTGDEPTETRTKELLEDTEVDTLNS